MRNRYSPHTLEFIETNDPAPWMLKASTECPIYDTQSQSAKYLNNVWVIEDVVPEVPIPTEISIAQGHYILADKGVYKQVVDYIEAIENPLQKLIAQIAFYRTTVWSLHSPFLNQAATDLGFIENLADWFREGSTVIL